MLLSFQQQNLLMVVILLKAVKTDWSLVGFSRIFLSFGISCMVFKIRKILNYNLKVQQCLSFSYFLIIAIKSTDDNLVSVGENLML